MKPEVNERPLARLSGHLANILDITAARKEEIYLDLDRSATLLDASYWLQIIFSAGVATLGLVLNSPAVIIGAMLISPLMGPILSGGLALATGDLILGLRSGANLLLSCTAAIGFSVILVDFLPFKELTAEITARTNPTTLDLAVAIFSGAIGSIATCKEAKGIVTSIPGVAIAVALMPPLSVVGYGIGLAISLNGSEGMRVARGGGLLFLTNLVAITFTAMLVFLALRIDTASAKQKIRELRESDRESLFFQHLLKNIHVPEKVSQIGGYGGRFLMIFIPLVLILIPLSQSLRQLEQEYAKQQQDNRVHRVATDIWQQRFGTLRGGAPRSELDQLDTSESNGKLTLSLRVFTSEPLTPAERTGFAQLVAAGLGRPIDSVQVQLLEIPTTTGVLTARTLEPKPAETPPSVAQLRSSFWQSVQSALAGVRLPPVAELVGYRVSLSGDAAMNVNLLYLADRDIGADAQTLITNEVIALAGGMNTAVTFERIPASFTLEEFPRNGATLSSAARDELDRAGQILQQQPKLSAEIITNAASNERPEIAKERANAIMEYLAGQWAIGHDRLKLTAGTGADAVAVLRLHTAGQAK